MTFTPTILGTGLGAFNFLERTRATQEGLLRQSPEVARDLAAVRERMTQIQSADALLEDRTLLRVALSAFGLEEDIDNTGFLRQVLDSDLTDGGSFANRLVDKRYVALARAFNFASDTGATLPGAGAADTLAPSLQALPTVDALFEPENATLLTRALEVFELDAETNPPALLRRVLQSDLNDPTSLVNRLGDPRYVDLVTAFTGQEDPLSDLIRARVSEDVADRLRGITSAADLIADTRLTRSVLDAFGLEARAGDTFFLEALLESDLNDPDALANTVADPRLRELALAFDFKARRADQNSIYSFAELAAARPESLTSSQALIEDTELLTAALKLYELEDQVENTTFIKEVLDSRLFDVTSTALSQEDNRYRALSAAFDFAAKRDNPNRTFPSPVEALITAVTARNGPAADAEAFFEDPSLYLAAIDLFDLPQGQSEINYTRRVLESDPLVPTSSLALANDDRYRLLANAVNFAPEAEGRSYPAGFAEAIIDAYITRQFEIEVGALDNSMRVSLAFERDLSGVLERTNNPDGRWFEVLAAPPLRAIFEGAFNLPQSFGQLDIDRQLAEVKDRAERFLGSSDLGVLAAPETREEIQRLYLASQAITGSSGQAAVTSPTALLFAGLV